ncbi:DivIVA domain-containing protein [Staphylococcus pasteuri]|uniref:Cell division initiation protein n=2 Tax=Staphylococcus TaxID=1279 RepID=A0ABY1GYR9_9STAP|nr:MULTISPECIES: DivIVA domain-containing protein [Staphylococcus]ODB76230.1 cell division protein DivIVA [Staphylococcus sp. AOAB]RQX28813.1 DivIVA domain-containing protein [Staphylococcus warneri]KKI57133.1 Cell division initiation protein DivIVA [Staphylococcus pasteuri]MBL3398042.1 DivIVA domain-containing protein [Staphylococcus pasteuri]MBM6507093.1 DivIVA domain-containing protein [Staphylococcus pasteuri]
MPFTPSEIKSKEFTRVKNGLEPTEVANYLEQLSSEIERLKEDKKQLEKVIEERDTNIKSYQDVHQSVTDALVQAQKAGEETKLAANKDAEATIAKAQAQADQIVNDAVEKARRLAFQTEDMKRQSKVFRSRFRMLVEAQLDLLKNDDWDYLLNYDLDAEQVTLEDIHHLNENDLTEEEKAMKQNAQSQSQTTESSESTVSTSQSDSVTQSESPNQK